MIIYKLIDSVIAYREVYIGPPQVQQEIIVLEPVPMNQPQGPVYMGVNPQPIQPAYPLGVQPTYLQGSQQIYNQVEQPKYNYQ